MVREIKESDWKVFRRLHDVARERFCQRVIQEVQSVTEAGDASYQDCYLQLCRLIRNREQEMAKAFNDPRRTNALILLANMKELGLLTDEELRQLSADAREAIQAIERIRNL